MARQRLRVQHWVACLQAQVVPPAGPDNFYNLLGVGYVHQVPADAELPWAIPRLDLFARFLDGSGVGEFEIHLVWLDAPEGERAIDSYGPQRVAFRPGAAVRDFMFSLRSVLIVGLGRYRLELRAVAPRMRRPVGTEFITTVRHP